MNIGCLLLCAISTVTVLAGCKHRAANVGSGFSSVNENTCSVDPVEETYSHTKAYKAGPPAGAGKKPALMYYLADTDEPFMQYTVQHELDDLRRACELTASIPGAQANFTVFLNSYFVQRQIGKAEFIACVNGVYRDRQEFPAEIQRILEGKRRLLAQPEINWEEIAGPLFDPDKMRYITRFANNVPEIRDAFFQHPYAHPDFFAVLFEFTRALFPVENFVHFIHLKSHGSDRLLLTGLTVNGLKAKSDCQHRILKDKPALFQAMASAPVQPPQAPPAYGAAGLRPLDPASRLMLMLMGLGDTQLGRVPLTDLLVEGNPLGAADVGGGALGALFLGNMGVRQQPLSSLPFRAVRLGDLEIPEGTASELRSLPLARMSLAGVQLGSMQTPGGPLGQRVIHGKPFTELLLGDLMLGPVRLRDYSFEVPVNNDKTITVKLGDLPLSGARTIRDIRLGTHNNPALNTHSNPALGTHSNPVLGTHSNPALSIHSNPSLGSSRLGASQSGNRLGVTRLGSDNHFGMPSYAINGVILDLLLNSTANPGGEIGFLLLESCDSKLGAKQPISSHLSQYVPQLRGYYSSTGSLWFRNIDWDDLWLDWALRGRHDAAAFQDLMAAETESFVNYVPKDAAAR